MSHSTSQSGGTSPAQQLHPADPATHWLREQTRPKVAILGAPNRARVTTALERLRPAIAAHADIVVEDLEFTCDFSEMELDMVIVLGGDGSILQAARQLAGREIPVLGVNCGTLGFLAALSADDFLDAWPEVCRGGLIVIQPISPHTLTYRPLVDSADTCLEIVVARPHATTNIVTDGRVLGQIQRGDRVAIRASSHRFRMLAVAGQNEYRTLREKLGWGGSVLR